MADEAWMLLAARIPPELFDSIIFYVNCDHIAQRYTDGLYKTRKTSSNHNLDALKRLSLVCRFWANKCRQYIFSGKILYLVWHKDAELFRKYTVEGSSYLIPIYQLVSEIWAYQSYEGGSSFLHLLYLPVIQEKLTRLQISGPIPDDFHTAKLDTPYWGVPSTVVLPPSFVRNAILVANLRLPSFHHVTKYIRYFTCATRINFHRITWNGEMPISLPHVANAASRRRKQHTMQITAFNECTDPIHLALTTAMLNPQCPLHRISDVERAWMHAFMTLLWGNKKHPYVCIEFKASEHQTTMRLEEVHFVFENIPAQAVDPSSPTLSVVGIHTYAHTRKLPFPFDAVVEHVRTRPTIRAVAILFSNFDTLRVAMQPYTLVLDPVTDPFKVLLAYRSREPGIAVGVDPRILKPNGRHWTNLPTEGFHRDKSSEMLRRQLRKN